MNYMYLLCEYNIALYVPNSIVVRCVVNYLLREEFLNILIHISTERVRLYIYSPRLRIISQNTRLLIIPPPSSLPLPN